MQLAGLFLALSSVPLAQDSTVRRVPDELDLAVGRELATPDTDPLGMRLVRLGSQAIPALFETLVTKEAPHQEPDKAVVWLELDALQSSEVRASLLGEPARALLDFLRHVEGDARRRREAVRLLGDVGESRDLPYLVWLVDPGGEARIEHGVRDEVQEAFEGILSRSEDAHEPVLRAYDASPKGLLAGIIWALGGASSEERLWTLARLLGRTAEADPLILAEMARIGRELPHPIAEDVLAATRPYLGAREPEVVLSSIELAERLEDVEAIPDLIELLGNPLRALSGKALQALQSLAGIQLPLSPVRWEEWHRKASEWRAREAPKFQQDIANGSPGRASHALMEVSKWRAFRHELADGVAAGLERDGNELVVLTCSVLGHLGSWKSVPALAQRLSDGDPAVQRAALLALRSITKADAGSDQAAWLTLARGPLQPLRSLER